MFRCSVLLVEALFFAVTAIYSFSWPEKFALALGLDAGNQAGITEIRAQYGGFFAAAAIVQIAGLTGRLPLATGLLVGAMTFGGLITGRVLATILNRGVAGYTRTIKALLVVDMIGLLASIAALNRA